MGLVRSYIVLRILNERRPMVYYLLAALLFALSQLAFFLLGRVLCTGLGFKAQAGPSQAQNNQARPSPGPHLVWAFTRLGPGLEICQAQAHYVTRN
ncbi:hypothetical protein D9611_014602 [Ephemerocybe angulata]|uniref:Uncharacterized protein n=1 Tax=Ephemerocybe angulata TaxID=980116 RepID=A0A8H5CAF1_9AGAR|nr:hypothetical protein D9611_014602 [Tulosesus angulatus]